MKQFFKDHELKCAAFYLLYSITLLIQVINLLSISNWQLPFVVFSAIAMAHFLRKTYSRKYYFFSFLILSIISLLFLSFSGILYYPQSELVSGFIVIGVLIGFLKNINISSIVYNSVFISAVFITIFQLLYGTLDSVWNVFTFHLIVRNSASVINTAKHKIMVNRK